MTLCVCLQRMSMIVCKTDFPLNIVPLYDNIGNARRRKRIWGSSLIYPKKIRLPLLITLF